MAAYQALIVIDRQYDELRGFSIAEGLSKAALCFVCDDDALIQPKMAIVGVLTFQPRKS